MNDVPLWFVPVALASPLMVESQLQVGQMIEQQ